MYKDIVVNGTLIIAFLFLVGQIFKDTGITTESSAKLRIINGVLFGFLGVSLMIFSLHLADNIIIDMRFIALSISAITGGWLSVIITSLMMIITRLMMNGINENSIIAVTILILLTIITPILTKIGIARIKKYWIMISISLFLFQIALYIMYGHNNMFYYISILYSASFLVTAYFSLLVYDFIRRSNELYRRYKEESQVDFLTGVYNHRQFNEFLDEITMIKENPENLSILAIDIDHFKIVNDTYGHPEGDLILAKLGKILKSTTRKFDIVGRTGGEEFTIMLLDCTNHRALEIAERIRSTVENETFPISSGKQLHITISIGISNYPETTDDTNLLIKQADIALYAAKKSGRNRVCTFNVLALLKVHTDI